MFHKKRFERVTITDSDEELLISISAHLRAYNSKTASVSKIKSKGDAWVLVVESDNADEIYFNKVYPIIIRVSQAKSTEVILEFADATGQSGHWPEEVLVSVKFDSESAIGDSVENDTIRNILHTITNNIDSHIAYMIISGGALTLAIPSKRPVDIQELLEKELLPNWTTMYMIKINTRSR